MKKMLCALLALLMVIPAFSAFAEEEAGAGFPVPAAFAEAFNSHVNRLLEHLGDREGLTVEEVDALKTALTVAVTDTQDWILYYDNPDWSVEFAFPFADSAPDPDAAAGNINLAVRDGVDESVRHLLEEALILSLADFAEFDMTPVLDWAAEGKFEGEQLPLFGGWTLNLIHLSDGCFHYAVLPPAK